MSMKRGRRLGLVLALGAIVGHVGGWATQAQEKPKGPADLQTEQHAPAAPPGATNQDKPKKLNPFNGVPEAVAEGRTLYMQAGCPGCHGMGGGGMCPSLMDDAWKFGGDDETVFKLIKGDLPQQTMPAVFGKTLTDEQVWKIIAWMRSIYKGDPAKIVW
jgi:mono/diheme cytochrome c family protein